MASDAKTIFRSKHRRNYTVVSNEILYNPGLSGKAKWVLMYLLSKPEDWQTRIGDIVNHGTDGRDAVLSGIKELKAAGYLQKVRVTCPETKRVLRWETHVFDEPQPELQNTGKPDVEKPDSGKPQSGKSNATKYGSNQRTELNNHSLTTTKEVGSSSEGDRISLDRESMEQAREVADYLAGWGYFGMDGQEYAYKKSKTLINACKGHTLDSAYRAVIAAAEFMDVKRAGGEAIRSAEAVLIKALTDEKEPSGEYEARWEEARQQQKVERDRIAAMDYNARWLSQARAAGLIEIVAHNETQQHYDFRYHDDTTVRNCNLWELPPKYAHLTVDDLTRREVSV